jgi:membrane fusion protein
METAVPYLDSTPPHWAANGLAYVIVAIAAFAALGSVTVGIPETLSTSFVLTPCSGALLARQIEAGEAFIDESDLTAELACAGEKLQAKLALPEAESGRLRPGQRVILLYEAFPYGRYGARYGTLRWVGAAVVDGAQRRAVHGFADIDEQTILVDGRLRPLRAGMSGGAKVLLDRRPLVAFALDPLRQLKQSFAAPPDRPPRQNPL